MPIEMVSPASPVTVKLATVGVVPLTPTPATTVLTPLSGSMVTLPTPAPAMGRMTPPKLRPE